MTQVTEAPLPRYFKDQSGYCYAASEALAKKGTLEPWDGAVDANGFAVDVLSPATPKRSRSQTKRVAPQKEDPLDAALDELRDVE